MLRIACALILITTITRAGENWTGFRGSDGDGHSDSTNLPTKWSESQNVTWKTAIPGEGWSSPVIWKNHLWLTTALDHGKSLRAIEVNKTSGAIEQNVEVFRVDNPPAKHAFNSYASPTAVVEEGRVYLCFGTSGSACVDSATGKLIWVNDDLKVDHLNGPGSSPVIFQDLFLLCCDGADVQYFVALNKNTGKVAWKTPRSFNHNGMNPDLKKAYNTPLVVHNDGRDEVLSVGAHRFYCYDVHTGEELWFCDQPGFSNVSQPVFAAGTAYLSTGFGKADLWAIRCDGAGDVGKTHVAWKYKRGTPCRSTPLIVGEGERRRIFMVTDNGIAHYLNAESGDHLWLKRLGAEYSASPLLADGLIYCFDEKGAAAVIRPDDRKPDILATNALDDGIMGTPAISGSALYIRTKTNLYRIENHQADR